MKMDSSNGFSRNPLLVACIGIFGMVIPCLCFGQDDEAEVTKRVNEVQRANEARLISFSVHEEYKVERNGQNAATLAVQTTYSREKGKDFSNVLSRTGSSGMHKFLLNGILHAEEEISKSGSREQILITSDNYDMKLLTGTEDIQGRRCQVLQLKPKRKSPYLLEGHAWIDSKTQEVIRIEGRPSARPSIWSGRPLITREYMDVDGLPLAVSARAVSNSLLFGSTTVSVEYRDYKVSLAP